MEPYRTQDEIGSANLVGDVVGSKEEHIVERIFEAVVNQRLLPGTKLSEASLCDAFNVGRMHIRRSLVILESRGVVEIISNRGAFIASPNEKEAHDVFEARLAIEPSVVKLAIRRATSADIDRLERHLLLEHAAHESGNRQDAIRLSGLFHIMLAEIADNSVMLRTIKELVARASLIIGMYGAPGVSNCRDDDHNELIDTFVKGDEELAASLMYAHLNKILNNIDLEQTTSSNENLRALFNDPTDVRA